MQLIKHLPNALTILRFFMAGFLAGDAIDGNPSWYFVPLFLFSGLTDFLDGFIACQLKVESQSGCVLDGYADIAFYVAAFLSAYFICPEFLRRYIVGLVILVILQLVSWGFSLIKFGKITSYHTYSAKAWGACFSFLLGVFFL